MVLQTGYGLANSPLKFHGIVTETSFGCRMVTAQLRESCRALEVAMTAVLQYFNELEIGLCLRVNRYGRPRAIRRFFSIVSRMGDGGAWLVLGGAVLLVYGSKAVPFILQAAAIAAIGITIYKLLKHRLVRERPYIANGNILCGAPPLDRYSFPSGHTLHAACFTVLFGDFEPLLLLVAAPFAILVAISRIVLGLHYPSDVLVGAAIGIALAIAGLAI